QYASKSDLDDLDDVYLKQSDYVPSYTKTESDAKYALYAKKTDLKALDTQYASKSIQTKLLDSLEKLDLQFLREEVLNLVEELESLKKRLGTTPDDDPPATGELVSSVRLEQTVSVRPNPASNYLEIETPEETHLKIIDPTGKVLHTEQISRGVHRIPIQELPAGSYLLLLQIGAQATSYTFIKG
ncbi:MAG: T9SS type A sorting domain-containing protein, partial [Cytophagales bacterium]|nr:T9SS type A sorting domain-containing protein [Cytophagales bacterium]